MTNDHETIVRNTQRLAELLAKDFSRKPDMLITDDEQAEAVVVGVELIGTIAINLQRIANAVETANAMEFVGGVAMSTESPGAKKLAGMICDRILAPFRPDMAADASAAD